MNPEREKISDNQMLIAVSSDIHKLGLAYFYTHDDSYVEWINELIRVYYISPDTRMNPNFNYAQIIKGRRTSASVTIGAIPLIQLIEGVQLAMSSEKLNNTQLVKLKGWFSDLAEWMTTDEKAIKDRDSKNNIGIYYTVQISAYNLFAGNKKKAKWALEEGGRRIIDEQIDSNGKLSAELRRAKPWEYVKYTLTAIDYMVQLSNSLNVDIERYENPNGGSIKKMSNWLLEYAKGARVWEFSSENVSPNQVQKVLARTRFFSGYNFDADLMKGINSDKYSNK